MRDLRETLAYQQRASFILLDMQNALVSKMDLAVERLSIYEYSKRTCPLQIGRFYIALPHSLSHTRALSTSVPITFLTSVNYDI